MTPEEKEIENVLGALVDRFKEENKRYLKNFENEPAIKEATIALKEGDLFKTYMSFDGTYNKIITAFYEVNLKSEQMQFMMQNYSFIDGHFDSIIEKKEGYSCSADKTGYLLRAIFNFYENGIEIKHNYDQKYTYHLPEKIFKDHQEIIDYFEALFFLYYGRSEKFLKVQEKYKDIPDVS